MENIPFCFLNVYKPRGITSFDVIYKLRKHLKIKKTGHSGTLDPFADGVMQVAIGNATRLLEYLNSDKEYIANVKFGYSSTTLDTEGEITKLQAPSFTENELNNVLKEFTGKIEQTPPKFSAIKINGKKLCDLARKNPDIEIDIKPRTIEIYDIKLLEFKDYEAKIKVSCSKGTYIRTLGSDIAKKLGTDAYLTALTRTKAGNFELEKSVKTEETDIKKDGINPILALDIPLVEIDDREYNLVKNGVSIARSTAANKKNKTIGLIYKNNLVSIGILSDNIIKVKKFFNSSF